MTFQYSYLLCIRKASFNVDKFNLSEHKRFPAVNCIKNRTLLKLNEIVINQDIYSSAHHPLGLIFAVSLQH